MLKVTLVLMLAAVTLTGCDRAADPTNVADRGTNKAAQNEGVIDYGNGVYYIARTESDFANTLAVFLKDHPCKMEGMAGNGTNGYGIDRGYFIVCR
jgi:hypothetical protein